MRRKAKLRRKHVIKINKITISIILILIFVFMWLLILSKEISPILSNYATLETEKMATQVINNAVTNEISNKTYLNDLIKTTLNENGEIVSVDFDPIYVNKALTGVTNTVQENLKKMEEGNIELSNNVSPSEKNGIIYEIPFGIVFYTPILADLGPKIPVKVRMVGSVVSNVKTKITNYGINNALLEVLVEIEVSEQIILPFISQKETIKQEIPVAMKVIQGTVPKYYGGSMSDRSSLLSIPIENEE